MTYATYETFSRLYIVPGLGTQRLSRLQVQPRKVQKWINSVAATCQCCAQGKDACRRPERRRCCALTPPNCCEEYVSTRTLSDIRACLRSALQAAIESELVDKNVAQSIKLPHEFGLIFTTRYGTPIEPRNFNRSWDARCRKAGVPKITVHSGRRTCGSLLADLDVHPRVAMRILRHAQFAVTMEIYTDVSSEATRAGMKRLGESLEG